MFASKSKKLTYAALNQIVDDCVDHIYPMHYKSEEPPTADLYHYMKSLVGRTVDKAVFNETDHYYIVFLFNRDTASVIPMFQQLTEDRREVSTRKNPVLYIRHQQE